MLADIMAGLAARTGLAEWTVRQITTREEQLYAAPTGIEAQRSVSDERFIVDVLCHNNGPDGSVTCGTGNATVLPGGDISAALDAALLMAGLVHNPRHTIPAPAPLPDVPLADHRLQADPAGLLAELHAEAQAAAAGYPRVRLSAAEYFARETQTRLCNSRGIDATQVATQIDGEWVLLARDGDHEVESFVALTRRRAADLDLDGEIARRCQAATDLLVATEPPSYRGAVVLRGGVLAEFLRSGVIETLGSAAAKYQKLSNWDVGRTVFRGDVKGDPFTVWATRVLPYGTHAGRFDDEGLPGARVPLIRENTLAAFSAEQRYADYLGIPATGAFGDLELPPGLTPSASLLAEPHVEVVAFSSFNPDEVTGDFACEIRLGYVVDGGRRAPFKGGMLVGNLLDALADVRWSAESGFYGFYQGPQVARFADLTVAGA